MDTGDCLGIDENDTVVAQQACPMGMGSEWRTQAASYDFKVFIDATVMETQRELPHGNIISTERIGWGFNLLCRPRFEWNRLNLSDMIQDLLNWHEHIVNQSI